MRMIKIKCFIRSFFTKLNLYLGGLVIFGGLYFNILPLTISEKYDNVFRWGATIIGVLIIIYGVIISLFTCIKLQERGKNLFILEKFPKFYNEEEINEITEAYSNSVKLIFDSNNYRENSTTNWEKGILDRKQRYMEEIVPILAKITEIHYIGITQIPFAIFMGYLIGDMLKIKYYQYQRETPDSQNSWSWPSDRIPSSWNPKITGISRNFKGKNAFFLISQSYKIHQMDLPFDKIENVEILEINVNPPSVNDLQSEIQVQTMSKIIQNGLNHLRLANSIHIFSSVPVATAFAIGQNIHKSVHPKIHVYRYKKSSINIYKKVFTLND